VDISKFYLKLRILKKGQKEERKQSMKLMHNLLVPGPRRMQHSLAFRGLHKDPLLFKITVLIFHTISLSILLERKSMKMNSYKWMILKKLKSIH
jgi:hypothetical protein